MKKKLIAINSKNRTSDSEMQAHTSIPTPTLQPKEKRKKHLFQSNSKENKRNEMNTRKKNRKGWMGLEKEGDLDLSLI